MAAGFHLFRLKSNKHPSVLHLGFRFQILAMAHDPDGFGCSSSSSGSTKRWKYHVFLSFRGEDTRTNFTDHLYAALISKGLKTFRDEEELERGQSIRPSLLQAIEESRSAIVVLSPSYASSTWCLDELQKIIHLKEESSLQVFPIFFRVDPSDVKKQKGSFAEEFKKHEERFTQDKMKVQRWRDALEKVATISGWHSKDRYETEFIESIAKEMMSKLPDESPSDLGRLIGIEPKLHELESIVASESEGVHFIGIWGIGGIGKTTLARAFYEQKRKNFEIHYFFHNIREVYEKDGLISLQRKLLFYLNKSSMEVDDCYEGKKLIKNKLGHRKVLLALDDVSDISQLENLAPKQGLFSEGSIIIITARDKHLLSSHGVSAKYNVRFLSKNDSFELFLQKAFKGDKPNKDYLDLARSVIEYAGGLPLVLKVLGSFLCERTIEEWKDALVKFKKVPPNDILKILQVSYDGLDIKEKTIFLDIACFFNGMVKDHVIQILETLDKDLHPKIGMSVLIDKSLVINYEGRLWVHAILQDMGKYIVCQESPDVGKRSRILSLEDANHVLEKNMGTEAIWGIGLMLEKSYDAFWDPEAFSKMTNLKLLIVSRYSYVSQYCQLNLPRGLKSLSKELKVIKWEGFPLFYLPSQTQLHELVDLYMPHSMLKELCRGRQSFRSLKFIDLSHSKDLIKTPNFDGIPHLERLILKGCSNLVEIHRSLGQHKKLVIVDLKDCRKVKMLPRKFEMICLKTLVLSGCSKVRKLPEFGKEMERLSKLDLERTAIAKLPQSLGNLIGLVELNLKDCKRLFCLPYNVCKLKALKIIRISGCSKLSGLPENLIENEALEVLDLSCIAIKGLSLCEYNGEVQYSSSWSCFSLLQGRPSSPTKFMLLPSLSSLTKLNLSLCNLRDGSLPDDISELSSLKRLFLGGNNFIDLPSGLISNLSKLQAINLFNCRWLRSLPQFPSNLSAIFAIGCLSMRHYGSSQHLWDFIESFRPQQALNLGVVVDLNIKSAITTLGSRIPFNFFKRSTRVLITTGSEVPSWFYNQNYFNDKEFRHPNVSFIISISPHYRDSSEWWGIAICLVIERDLAFGGWDTIYWTFRFPNQGFQIPYLPGEQVFLDPNNGHRLYIAYIRCSCLVVDGLQMAFFSENAIKNKSPAIKIKKCGWRAVRKEDVEAWRITRDKGCSSIINEVEKNEGYSHCPRYHDQFTERKIIVEVDGTYCHLNDKAVHEMHKDIAVIMEIKGMLEWDWSVDVQVFHKDGNGIANLLAKRALDGAMGLQLLGPKAMMEILQVTDVRNSSVVSEKKKMSLIHSRIVEIRQESEDEVDEFKDEASTSRTRTHNKEKLKGVSVVTKKKDFHRRSPRVSLLRNLSSLNLGGDISLAIGELRSLQSMGHNTMMERQTIILVHEPKKSFYKSSCKSLFLLRAV
ncbi:hypothetical protein K1719_033953 [Acacia pycnantha]|nr:hypothetical protein K1719_033953 [Acacia pycnantha]